MKETGMNIYSKPGTKVRFKWPRNGYDSDKELAAKFLKQDEIYTVAYTQVHNCHTDVRLVEVPNIDFNSVHFQRVDDTIITVRGYSDDIISISGTIREEYYSGKNDSGYLIFSDGTILQIIYDNFGYWRIFSLATGDLYFEKREAADPEINYSDIATLSGSIRWIVYSEDIKFTPIAKFKGESK